MENLNMVGEKMKSFTGKFEKFVSQNLSQLQSLDVPLKSILQGVEEFIRESSKGRLNLNQKIEVKIKKLANYKGDLPKYQSALASGFDVRAMLDTEMTLKPGERALIPAGLSFEIPAGYEIQARPRSGLAIKEGVSLVNSPGTIDADYRGEVKIIVINLGQQNVVIKDQDRIAQLVLCPVLQAELVDIEELAATERGAGGFGSTGL